MYPVSSPLYSQAGSKEEWREREREQALFMKLSINEKH